MACLTINVLMASTCNGSRLAGQVISIDLHCADIGLSLAKTYFEALAS
jgi:hypothetical protein